MEETKEADKENELISITQEDFSEPNITSPNQSSQYIRIDNSETKSLLSDEYPILNENLDYFEIERIMNEETKENNNRDKRITMKKNIKTVAYDYIEETKSTIFHYLKYEKK